MKNPAANSNFNSSKQAASKVSKIITKYFTIQEGFYIKAIVQRKLITRLNFIIVQFTRHPL